MIDESLVAKPKIEKKPKWIRVKLPTGKKYTELRSLVDKYKLNTICSSGSCPNMGECWGEGTATFMILFNTNHENVPIFSKNILFENAEYRKICFAIKKIMNFI